MAQVKETIDLLTKILNRNGTSKTKAEIFRLAKFNDEEATGPFWKLLFELLYFCKYGVIDDVTVTAYTELSTEEVVVYVKREMQRLGFVSHAFSSVPNDMSEGSRELLLAFAWLLCKGNLIDKFMDKCASPVEEDLSVYQLNNLDDSNSSGQLSARKPLKPSQRVQHLQYLNGKLRSSLRRLYALQQQKNKLQHKVHESTQGVSLLPDRNHLSVMEVHLLRQPELLKKILKLLEKDNDRLQCMLTWKKQEDVFWKWMESVLDLKLKEKAEAELEDKGQPSMTFYNIPPDSVKKMNISRKQLEESILKYESIIVQLEELWESQRSKVSTQELDNLLASINMEISLQRANLALDNTQSMLNSRDPSFTYIRPSQSNKKLINVTDHRGYPSDVRERIDFGVDIKSEISELELQLQRLENELVKKQSNYRVELDNMAPNIPESICIQPMSC